MYLILFLLLKLLGLLLPYNSLLISFLCNNFDAVFITDPEKIKDSLINQITGRVRWKESVENMNKLGKVEKFIELGSGGVLSGLVRRIDKNLEGIALESISDIENFARIV